MGKKRIHTTFRVYHRYLGFFLAGIMSIYAFSGSVMVFRTTDFLKVDKTLERELQPGLSADELGGNLFLRDFAVVEETANTIEFNSGTYNRETGVAVYQTKELPAVIQEFERLHKATTGSPLFFLNITFGIALLFFSVSAFFMYAKNSKVLKRGIYVGLAGVIFAVIMVLL